ncbi:hypothetical protein GH810_15645 [Acetobacterium paludosum]|uniref:Desulfoferrodoxin ferrous iron-binding domain-containing protein n=1 Tax=Acetobacterium paludosum TaxID=52693 RepID=A0A923KR28_9FIRM|nr:hypothetical protein [Acetobacterium paludosum]MBC3889744.1 hypothetical protein [Acetobacterium paludosum]
MQEKKFGIKRSRATTKPKAGYFEVAFYQCENCKSIFQSITTTIQDGLICCNKEMERLKTKDPSEIANSVLINYRIVGGYNDNAIEVTWEILKKKDAIEWIYIKTFTGGQIKYITKQSKTSVIFALADEDAYVYCDEDPCLECTFRCKRGFEIYIYLNKSGLIKIPMDRMQANW